MIRSRHELKYLVTEAQAGAIAERVRPFMRPDHHSRTGCYPLVSLYLDTDDLLLCRQSLDGVKNRFKLRIRSYSDEPDAPCFFEIKRRINQIIIKSRARLPRCDLVPLLTHEARPRLADVDDCRNMEQFLYYRRQLNARPMARVRYMRQAFVSRCGDDVRVTFDRQLRVRITRTPELTLNGPGWQRLPERGVVFEIKLGHGYPMWVNRMVQEFCLRPQSLSKYAHTVTHACAMRFCAPVIRPGESDGPIVAFS